MLTTCNPKRVYLECEIYYKENTNFGIRNSSNCNTVLHKMILSLPARKVGNYFAPKPD